MSANNQILINKKNYKVYHCDVDDLSDNGLNERDLIGQGTSLEEALEILEKWKEEREEGWGYCEIEYGIRFI